MRLIIEDTNANAGKWAARHIAERINAHQAKSDKPFVLGLPTGSTPLSTYKELIALNKEGKKKHILVFFKVEDNRLADTEEIKAAEAKVSDGYAHYYKKFTHTDTIKLELLQYISSALGKSGDIGVRNGIVYVGDFVPEDISLKNVYAYQKNQLLENQKESAFLLNPTHRVLLKFDNLY